MCKVLVVDKLISRDFVNSTQQKSFILNLLNFSSLEYPLSIGCSHLNSLRRAITSRSPTYSPLETQKALLLNERLYINAISMTRLLVSILKTCQPLNRLCLIYFLFSDFLERSNSLIFDHGNVFFFLISKPCPQKWNNNEGMN